MRRGSQEYALYSAPTPLPTAQSSSTGDSATPLRGSGGSRRSSYEDGGEGSDVRSMDNLQRMGALQLAKEQERLATAVLEAFHAAPHVQAQRTGFAWYAFLTRFMCYFLLFTAFVFYTPAAYDANQGASAAFRISVISAFETSYSGSITVRENWQSWVTNNILWDGSGDSGTGGVFACLQRNDANGRDVEGLPITASAATCRRSG